VRPSGLVGVLVVLAVAAACSSPPRTAPSASPTPAAAIPPSLAGFVPPGAPEEDVRYFNEWPSPNNGLYNTRLAHSTISATSVAKLKLAWTLPLTHTGLTGRDFANPVIANGVVYLQDGASNVMAVSIDTGQVLWTHMYSSQD
jgi:outer membrane protein assembly factor BamB